MTPSRSSTALRSPGSTARTERDQLRALLLEHRPDLAGQLVTGPSGALVIPLARGGSIEIGRMRRRGAVRWVVAVPEADGARLREPPSLPAVARAALDALPAAPPSARRRP
ncbi:hypothetical protein [Brachybacterium sp. YJGR34]|uniref:hypothetical protein n=1 Tax=Brachybacterium sp. YJGR34 TaxID=2059911 RepID=UPI000E0A638E|nr:hypothetical protein [Brachybacterium sp. YJGR34]